MMMALQTERKYIIYSLVSHLVILFILVLGFDYNASHPVFENTNEHDVISAVVLGDTAKSKILPKQKPPEPEPIKEIVKKELPVKSAQPMPTPTQKDVIALTKPDKKKLAAQKALEALKKPSFFGKDLLNDIKMQKKIVQKEQNKLQSKFQKTLRDQSEKSLRQQLLNEEIKLQGTESRQSQGEVNKYKALILQAISQHWIIPTQANKRLYCELMIRIAPGGMVLDVQVTKTSGDPSLDSSARAAVLKASPLPVPADPNEFDAFRQFVLKVKPENILT